MEAAGVPILDLSPSNPSAVALPRHDAALRRALARADASAYRPDPRGLPGARRAIAEDCARRGTPVDPDRLLLCASTSEAYAFTFRLLCDPGDAILAPRPAYPLLDWLARLDALRLETLPLRREGRWRLDAGDLPQPGPHGPRALVLVNPNNPTGSFLEAREARDAVAWARRCEATLIVDEVFASYPLEGPPPLPRRGAPDAHPVSFLGDDEAPNLVLDGISKSCGLPGLKLAWMVVQGPPEFRALASDRLETISDTFLSVGTPVQEALPELLEIGREMHDDIARRVRGNLTRLRALTPPDSPCELLPVEGGWNVVLRVPRVLSEETWALRLLERDHVLTQPGWLHDFADEAWLVLSLLTPPDQLEEGYLRILARAEEPDR
jgi:aspartate/methionine/tyrosine aminotransferase